MKTPQRIVAALLLSLISLVCPALAHDLTDIQPRSFNRGAATTVRVYVQNTSGWNTQYEMFMSSKPSGWTVSPSSKQFWVNANSTGYVEFSVTPPSTGGGGALGGLLRVNDLLGTWKDVAPGTVDVTANEAKIAVSSFVFSPSVVTNGGHPTSLTWTFSNFGPNDMAGNKLRYAAFISKSATMDASTSPIGTIDATQSEFSGQTTPGISLTGGNTQWFTIPASANGTYYVFWRVAHLSPSTLTDPDSSDNTTMCGGTIYVQPKLQSPTGVVASRDLDSKVRVAWNGVSGGYTYDVYRDSVYYKTFLSANPLDTGSEPYGFDDTGTEALRNYTYYVYATGQYGGKSDPSFNAQGLRLAKKPLNLTATRNRTDGIRVTWTVTETTPTTGMKYVLQKSDRSDGFYPSSVADVTGMTSYLDTPAVGQDFYYSVLASVGGIGSGIRSDLVAGYRIAVHVTVATSPSGLSITVDGSTYTSPQTFSWESGSSHTIATTSPQNGGTGVRYNSSSWSDGGAMSHIVTPNADTTYTATFTTQYYLTMNMGTGGSSVTPASGWQNSGDPVTINAAPASGYSFSSWTGSGSGSYSGGNRSASVTMNSPITETANFTPNLADVTVQPNPSGRAFSVDGTPYTTAQTFSWTPGASHTIAATSPQSGGTGIQYVWGSWSDGGAISHTVNPTAGTNYTVNFTTQYYLTMNMGTGGSSVTPASGWQNSGAFVPINASPAGGYSFSNWTGSGSGSYSGNGKSNSITMGGPISETASFYVPSYPTLSVTPTNQPVGTNAGSASFAVTNTGSGTMNWTAAVVVTWARIATGASGANAGTITVGYDANTNASSRQATIRVTATGATGSPMDVTINQQPGGGNRLHPADTNGDSSISLMELMTYIHAYQFGETWPQPPSPPPLMYVMVAVDIYQHGPRYINDGSSEPNCWKPVP